MVNVTAFTCVHYDHDNQSSRWEARYDGGYAAIDYVFPNTVTVTVMTGLVTPNETDLVMQFLNQVGYLVTEE